MKTLCILLCAPLCVAQEGPPSPPARAAASKETKPAAKAAEPDVKTLVRQAEVLAAAAKIGREWQNHVKNASIEQGMKLWGYTAFDGVSKASLTETLENQTELLGRLSASELLEDRSLVDLNGTAPGTDGGARGVYVTLNWISAYEKGLRREFLVIHEPAKGGGLKITGLRREELPTGRQAAAELAAGLGQLALLKLRGAPRERWEPWQRETSALADNLKLTLPAIPDSATGEDKAAGEKLATLIMSQAPPLFDALGPKGGAPEAKAILNAFALLLLYEPGDETCTRLAVLAGAEAEKAKLPPELWKPLIRAVSDKENLPAVHETVQRMAAGIAAHLAEQDIADRVKAAPKLILNQALVHMEQLPTYHVRAVLAATDGRESTMTASLAPGAMFLQLQGFDGSKESRLVNSQGFHVSHDGEKTWISERNPEAARGLCRTLQAPLDRASKFTDKHDYRFAAIEKHDGEQLYRFQSNASASPAPPEYWVLFSKNGPVIRRAQMKMKFGDLEAEARFFYTRLGKEVDIPVLEDIPEK